MSPIFLKSYLGWLSEGTPAGAVDQMPFLKGGLSTASPCLPHRERAGLSCGVGGPGISTPTPSGPRQAWWGRAEPEGNSSNKSEPGCTCVCVRLRGGRALVCTSVQYGDMCSGTSMHTCVCRVWRYMCVCVNMYPRALSACVHTSTRVFIHVCTRPHACSYVYARKQSAVSLWHAGGGCRRWAPLTAQSGHLDSTQSLGRR